MANFYPQPPPLSHALPTGYCAAFPIAILQNADVLSRGIILPLAPLPTPRRRLICLLSARLTLSRLLTPHSKGHNIMSLPVTASAAREVDLVGVFRYRDAYPTAIHLVGSG